MVLYLHMACSPVFCMVSSWLIKPLYSSWTGYVNSNLDTSDTLSIVLLWVVSASRGIFLNDEPHDGRPLACIPYRFLPPC